MTTLKRQILEDSPLRATGGTSADGFFQMRHVDRSHYETTKVQQFPKYDPAAYQQHTEEHQQFNRKKQFYQQAVGGTSKSGAAGTASTTKSSSRPSSAPRAPPQPQAPAAHIGPMSHPAHDAAALDKAMADFERRNNAFIAANSSKNSQDGANHHYLTSQKRQFQPFSRQELSSARPALPERHQRHVHTIEHDHAMRHVAPAHYRTSTADQFQPYDAAVYAKVIEETNESMRRRYNLGCFQKEIVEANQQQLQQQCGGSSGAPRRRTASERSSSSSSTARSKKSEKQKVETIINNNIKSSSSTTTAPKMGYQPRHETSPMHWTSVSHSAFPLHDVRKIVAEGRNDMDRDESSMMRDGSSNNKESPQTVAGIRIRHVPASHFETSTKSQFTAPPINNNTAANHHGLVVAGGYAGENRLYGSSGGGTMGYQVRRTDPSHWLTSTQSQFTGY